MIIFPWDSGAKMKHNVEQLAAGEAGKMLVFGLIASEENVGIGNYPASPSGEVGSCSIRQSYREDWPPGWKVQ